MRMRKFQFRPFTVAVLCVTYFSFSTIAMAGRTSPSWEREVTKTRDRAHLKIVEEQMLMIRNAKAAREDSFRIVEESSREQLKEINRKIEALKRERELRKKAAVPTLQNPQAR